MNIKIKTIVLLSIIAFSSCKTAKTVTKTVEAPKTTAIDQVLENIKKAQPTFQTANVKKLSMEFTVGERQVNVSSSCKIKCDSAIQLSVQPFMGIEMFKADFTTDSIHIYDKMNRKYYAVDYTYLKKKLGIDVNFNTLQSFFLNRYVSVAQNCTVQPQADNKNSVICENELLTQQIDLTPAFRVEKVQVKGKNKPFKIELTYSDFTKENEITFPSKMKLNANSETTSASCNLSIQKVEFNVPLKFQTTDTSRYVKGNIDDLLAK